MVALPGPNHILLYDGICNLCAETVKFTVANDPDKKISFASLQSKFAKPYLKAGNISDAQKLRSVVFVEDGNVYTHSTAILRLAVTLGGLLGMLASIAFLVPQVVRDFVYDLVGGNRYNIFGVLTREQSCMLATPALKRRFLDWDEQFGPSGRYADPRKQGSGDDAGNLYGTEGLRQRNSVGKTSVIQPGNGVSHGALPEDEDESISTSAKAGARRSTSRTR